MICAAVVIPEVACAQSVGHLQPTGVLGNAWFLPGFDLVQMKDMQLDTLMDVGRWIYLTSFKPDAVFTDNSIKKP